MLGLVQMNLSVVYVLTCRATRITRYCLGQGQDFSSDGNSSSDIGSKELSELEISNYSEMEISEISETEIMPTASGTSSRTLNGLNENLMTLASLGWNYIAGILYMPVMPKDS